jgi:hypothetical protein
VDAFRRQDLAARIAGGTEHRFSAYERLTLLVLFDKTTRVSR